MKRIVKHTHESGKESFEVQTNRWFFGLLPCRWKTETLEIVCKSPFHEATYTTIKAIFESLEECLIYFPELKTDRIINSEVILISKQ